MRCISLVILFGLFASTMHVSAATVGQDYLLTVPIDGDWVGGFGSVGSDGYDDWVLDVSPDGYDAQVTSVAVQLSYDPGYLELFAREADSTDSNGWVSQGGPVFTSGDSFIQEASLTFLALDAYDYALRVAGTPGWIGTTYALGIAAVSPVPLPAAAWLFISVFAGGVWLTRRRSGPTTAHTGCATAA